MPRIFSTTRRDDSTPRKEHESQFEFLDRAAGEVWERVRTLVQSWADHLPEEEYESVRSRLSESDEEQSSALLELYLHECLLRSGYMVTIHPDIPGTLKKPDFLVERANEGHFYLEATAPAIRSKERGAERRRQQLMDAINAQPHTEFTLALTKMDIGQNTLSGKDAAADLHNWLNELRNSTFADWSEQQTFTWDDGWSATFTAARWSSKARQLLQKRAISLTFDQQPRQLASALVERALNEKSSKYGNLQYPYVIAVGIDFPGDVSELTNHLYGNQCWETYGQQGWETQVRPVSRRPNGCFFGPSGARRQQVSGVLVVNRLMAHTITHAQAALWHHPEANHPLHGRVGVPGTVFHLRGDNVAMLSENGPAQHFGLPDDWPSLVA